MICLLQFFYLPVNFAKYLPIIMSLKKKKKKKIGVNPNRPHLFTVVVWFFFVVVVVFVCVFSKTVQYVIKVTNKQTKMTAIHVYFSRDLYAKLRPSGDAKDTLVTLK